MKYVNEALHGMWHEVALGETGSLVVQNIFENCLEDDKVCNYLCFLSDSNDDSVLALMRCCSTSILLLMDNSVIGVSSTFASTELHLIVAEHSTRSSRMPQSIAWISMLRRLSKNVSRLEGLSFWIDTWTEFVKDVLTDQESHLSIAS
jgi:hypothetical protein